MPYVRKRGKQVLIVHGERNPDTQAVEQRILFTLYSKGEALEALGKRGDGHGAQRFKALLERQYPDLRFNWPQLLRGVEDNLDVLPDLYNYRDARLRGGFRPALVAFTRALLSTDPQSLISAAELVAEHRRELEFVHELIDWRLQLCDSQERHQFNTDNPFYWLYSLQGREVPHEAAEMAVGYWQRRELDKAEAVFRLLTDAFAPYADGHNYLGLIALERERHDDAITEFQKAIELGRNMLRKKLAKKHYWRDHRTRPYMRGLHYLAIAYTRMGRFPDALAVCDRLELECGDRDAADLFRARVYLNVGEWPRAYAHAERLVGLWPEETFIAGLAAHALGETDRARVFLLHGTLNRPRTARMLAGIRDASDPAEYAEVADHNGGIDLRRNLRHYLGDPRSKPSLPFLRDLLEHPRLVDMVSQLEAAQRRWHARPDADRADFETVTRMQKLEFAESAAPQLLPLHARR